MPRATVSTEPEQFDLQSLPEAWVLLRRMSYGERLHRQDMAMQMSMEADQRTRTARMDVAPAQTTVAQFELKSCVVDHNLEDESGRKLDFNNPLDCAQLDGRVGEEIAELIDTLHDWQAALPNSGTRSGNSSGRKVLSGKVASDGAGTKR